MNTLVNKISKMNNCIVYPPTGIPKVDKKYNLPKDLSDFYGVCGGVELFVNEPYSIKIVNPQSFVPSNPIILSDDWKNYIPNTDISNDWFIVASSGLEQWISIDLNQARIGFCYDSFWQTHAVPGECKQIARSFTQFLEQILSVQGGYWYWLEDDFIGYGDAYD